MSSGYIKLFRKFQLNPLWAQKRKFSQAEAWIDILFEVQHSPETSRHIIKNKVVTCDRGQSIKSIETWARRWSWSRSAVVRFFDLLRKLNQIRTQTEHVTTRLTVCNYDTYNNLRNDIETEVKRKRNGSETEVNTDKKVKKEKKVKNTERFVKPSVQEVEEYAKSIDFILNGSEFCDYYEARGWMIGKTHMKCWKAAVRTWKIRRNKDQSASQGQYEEWRGNRIDA